MFTCEKKPPFGFPLIASSDFWAECPYENRDELYRDAIATVRGHRWRESGADKIERTKWIARKITPGDSRYSFGLSLVELRVTEWTWVESFETGLDNERELTWNRVGHYVPVDEARTLLWKRYGISLPLLSAYEEASEALIPTRHGDAWRGVITPASTVEALAYFGIRSSQNKLTGPPYYAPFIWQGSLWALKDALGFTADYITLNDLAVMIGHIERGVFDFLKGRDPAKLGPNNPGLSCGIRFPVDTTLATAQVLYVDGPEIEPKTAPLPGGLKGKPLEAFHKLLRLRGEIGGINTNLMVLWERESELRKEVSHQEPPPPHVISDLNSAIQNQPVFADTVHSEGLLEAQDGVEQFDLQALHNQLFQERASLLNRLLQERVSLEAERAKKSEAVRGLYRDLLRTLARGKERILGQHNTITELRTAYQAANGQWKDARARFYVDIPSPLEGLPAHMALLPAGLELPLQSATDPFGRAILKVVRPTQGQDRQFPLDLYFPEEQGLHAPFMERMAMIFGKRQWLLAQGLTAFAQLYRERGGYEEKGRSVRITIPEWCRAMRPDDSTRKRIADKGTSGLFGSDVKTADAFHAFFGAAQAIHFPDPRDDKHTVAGLIAITGYGTESGRGDYVHAAMNPDLYDLMVGDGQRPMFMVTNAAAMLSYREQELSYLPAAQFALELLARQNLYNRDTATLSSPTGDGFARATLMGKFGLVQGPSERPIKLRERFERLCKGLLDNGVVASIQRDGRERDEWRATKLHITMSEDYKQAYNINKMRQRLAREEKLLEAPFAPPKKARKAA
jgi:hypothetical protein